MSGENSGGENPIRCLDPRQHFYLVMAVGNTDGTVDFSSELPEAFTSLGAAVTHAKTEVEKFKVEMFIYRCRPITRVAYNAVLVEQLDN